MIYEEKDLAFSTDGDFVLDEDGDLVVSSDLDCLIDDINSIVKTHDDESEYFPGASLEDLIGLPNLQAVGTTGAQQIRSAIVNNGIVEDEDLTVLAIPGTDGIVYYVIITQNEQEIILGYTSEGERV